MEQKYLDVIRYQVNQLIVETKNKIKIFEIAGSKDDVEFEKGMLLAYEKMIEMLK